MLGLDPLGLAGGGGFVSDIGHPQVAPSGHGDVGTRALNHQHMLDAAAAAQAQRFVNDGFQRQLLATTHLVVGGDDHLGAGVFDAVAQALCREAAKHHRVGGTDAGTGLHGGHALDGHGDVDDDAVAFADAQRLHRVGDLAGARQQLCIGGAGDLAAVGLKNDGGFVALAFFDVAVQTVVRGVQGAVFKPLEKRRLAVVEGLGERLFPGDVFARQIGPVAGVVLLGFLAQGVVGVHAGDMGVFDKLCVRVVGGRGVFAHGVVSG